MKGGAAVYKYGMISRGFAIGCQPLKGIVYSESDPDGLYFDILVYSRQLSKEEIKEYELEYIGQAE